MLLEKLINFSFQDTCMQVNFAYMKMRILQTIASWKENLMTYYHSLTMFQKYAWLALFLGILLIILAIILW